MGLFQCPLPHESCASGFPVAGSNTRSVPPGSYTKSIPPATTGLVPGVLTDHAFVSDPFRYVHVAVPPLSAAKIHVASARRQTTGAVNSAEPDGVETL